MESPIERQRFWLPVRRLGISDIPQGLLGLPIDIENFTAANREFVENSEWLQWGNYVLRCGEEQMYVDREGECQIYSH